MTRRLDGLVLLAQRHDLRHSVRRRIAAAVNQDRRGLPLPVRSRLLPNRVTCSTRLLRSKMPNTHKFLGNKFK